VKLSELREGFKLSETLDTEAAAETVSGFVSWLQDNLAGIKTVSPRAARELASLLSRLTTAQSLLEEGDYNDG